MNEPQSNEDAELLPDRSPSTSPDLTLLPDLGDGAYEEILLPNPVRPPGPADDEIEPPIERHDPFAWMRGARWMNRRLSPSGRAAVLLRRELEAFPVIEGRDPNHADLDAIVQRTVDTIVPIIRREQATDIVYEELEKRREERIAKALQQPARNPSPGFSGDDPLPAGPFPDPTSPKTEIASSSGCAQIIDACQRQCTALFADKGLGALPGSGGDSHGRYRRCVRECVAPSGCSY